MIAEIPLQQLIKQCLPLDAASANESGREYGSQCETLNIAIKDIRIDSRHIQSGDLFVCEGGERFIDAAIAAGASAILRDPDCADVNNGYDEQHSKNAPVPVINIPNLANKKARLAAARYPVNVPIVGVTGTNGKSTLVALIAQLMQVAFQSSDPACEKHSCEQQSSSECHSATDTHHQSKKFNAPLKVATIGTLGVGFWGEGYQKTGMTTPDIFTNYAAAHQFACEGANAIAMEVSSHGLEQGRVIGLPIRTAVFTNLTQDHLDYHGGFDDYRAAKQKLFQLPSVQTAIINADDENADAMVAGQNYQVLKFGIRNLCDVRATDLVAQPDGMTFTLHSPWGRADVKSPLLGVFNVYNLLAAITAAMVAHLANSTANLSEDPIENQTLKFSKVIAAVNSLENIPGRMQRLPSKLGVQTVIDFAHTPDALEQALLALKAHTVGRIWVVFGCGGDRDQGKRALMGAVAEELADEVIITSDNPRSEDPEDIIQAIASGCKKSTCAFVDREQAIAFAIENALPGDTVLIAGKGHETEQIIGNKVLPFSDAAIAAACLAKRERGQA